MDQIVQQLIDFLKSATPLVWSALRQQVYVIAGQDIVWSGVLVLCSIIVFRKAGAWISFQLHQNRDDWRFGNQDNIVIVNALRYGSLVLTLGGCIALITDAAGRLVNPDYYAVEIVINMLRSATK